LTLQAGPDPERRGFRVEAVAEDIPVPARRVVEGLEEYAPVAVAEAVRMHGGVLEVLPGDSPKVLARLRLPSRETEGEDEPAGRS
jgi:hypothetical protein